MGLGGVAIATLPSVIFPKLMFSDRLGGEFHPFSTASDCIRTSAERLYGTLRAN